MIGQILGNRYEIIEEIGRGGMALVYKAKCSLLDRTVAVKVLQPQFADDPEFVRRFRREAQAAASLSHPNIVSIYDVGEENGIHYIVMEYIKGETLKALIRKRAPLPLDEAIRYAVQIALALAHAHRNEIVHCDIKPHNMLLTEDGRIKVTDFGLARVVSSTTLTYTESVIGSVHYFSPEQASGGNATKQSDIYATGVVLYEMLTGKLPFQGESPITIALQHIREQPKHPREIKPGIPLVLDRIVMKAMEKDPEHRYASALDLVEELRSFADDPHIGEVDGSDDDGCETQVIPGLRNGAVKGVAGRKSVWQRFADWVRNNPKKAALIAIVLLLTAALVTAGVLRIRDYLEVPEVAAPDVTGMSLAMAVEELEEQDLAYRVVGEVYSDLLPNYVVSQDPEPQELMKPSLPVSLVVSKGPEMVPVPNVIGMKLVNAELALTNENLKVGNVTEVFHATIAQDYVIDQNPRADIDAVRKDSAINLVVSLGPEPVAVTVPDLVGQYLANAERALTDRDLQVGRIIEDPDSPYAHGIVVRQSPGSGTTVTEGLKVDLTVSTRPDVVVSEPLRQRTIQIDVPSSGPETQQIRVDLLDVNRYRTIHTGTWERGDSFDLDIEWVGEKALIKIYVNGVFRESREVT